jgi:hypothetical protein
MQIGGAPNPSIEEQEVRDSNFTHIKTDFEVGFAKWEKNTLVKNHQL